MSISQLVLKPAVELAKLIERREISSVELTEACLRQIDSINPKLNAIVTLCPEQALDSAKRADQAKRPLGALHGLPVAHKDLALTRGVRTTYGSLQHEHFVPSENALIVQRMHDAGAVMLGKTNTPEYGAGSHTFNSVFGATRNPYDPDKSCGGSSGGAAVALASGMVALADGSDMGGSLRNPAAWCNVVGLRPTPGRVPSWPVGDSSATLPVEGPMARTVADIALFMQAISVSSNKSPLSQSLDAVDFSSPLERNFEGVRVAFSADFDGQLPFEASIVEHVRGCRAIMDDLGLQIEDRLPNLDAVDETFRTLRAHLYAGLLGGTLDQYREVYKPSLVWNIEQGLKQTPDQVDAALMKQQEIRARFDQLFETCDFLVLPVTQVSPFPIEWEYPQSINGEPMHTYLDWMRSCYWITVPGHPAVSVPAGFDASGLPVGLQIVGRWGDDFGVLQLAHAFEQATGFWKRAPEIASSE